MRKFTIMVGLFIGATLVIGAASVSAQQATANQNQGQVQSQIGGVGSASAVGMSDQTQGQTQSAAGGAGGSTVNSGNSAIGISNSFNGSDPIRSLPIPQAAQYDTRGGPAYFGRPNYQSTGPNFLSMSALVGVLNHMDLSEIEANDRGDIELVGQLLNELDDIDELDADLDEGAPQFMLNNDPDVMNTAGNNFKPIAVVTLKATDNNSMNSASLAVALAAYCKEVGGNRIVLVQEGVVKKLSSFGVGIGLATNYASVGSDGNDVGSTGAGGTGWSWGEAQYFSLPYLTAVIGRE